MLRAAVALARIELAGEVGAELRALDAAARRGTGVDVRELLARQLPLTAARLGGLATRRVREALRWAAAGLAVPATRPELRVRADPQLWWRTHAGPLARRGAEDAAVLVLGLSAGFGGMRAATSAAPEALVPPGARTVVAVALALVLAVVLWTVRRRVAVRADGVVRAGRVLAAARADFEQQLAAEFARAEAAAARTVAAGRPRHVAARDGPGGDRG